MQLLFTPNYLLSILLLRCVFCEGQCEAGELCRREVDSWASLSHPTGEADDYFVTIPQLVRDGGAVSEGEMA